MTAAIDTKLIAVEFCRQMTAALAPTHLQAVRERNAAETNPGVCHSHDVTDANELMLTAWMVARPDDDFECIRNDDESLSAWDEAWALAKAAGFDAEKIQC